MKIKALLVVGLFLMGLMFMAPQNAEAQTWATVSLDRVGAAPPSPAGHFTEVNGVFTNKYLRFHSDYTREMLATALTARSLDTTLRIRIMSDGLTIDVMWLMGE